VEKVTLKLQLVIETLRLENEGSGGITAFNALFVNAKMHKWSTSNRALRIACRERKLREVEVRSREFSALCDTLATMWTHS